MTTFTPKYNPGFQEDDELIRTFVVRHNTLELILETIRDNTGTANQHLLVVGPRGVGKTTLVRRAAAQIRLDADLSAAWFPLVFAEESYEVLSAGEFWLEALFHLAEQTDEPRWQQTYEDLRDEGDENRLRERALAQLLDFADAQDKRILLIVENLHTLLGDQIDEKDDWALRHTLLNEPRLMLVGTSTVRFEKLESETQAWFELFSIIDLPPLDQEEARLLWKAVAGAEIAPARIRPIQILTGGNPRLLRIVAEFAAGRSFRELMDDLILLIDSHTDYFKSQLDYLAASERKVFVALLNLWDPATSQEVGRAARMEMTKASALLHRLVNRGAAVVSATEGRTKWFQVAERLYNIYYLARRRGHPSNRVRIIVSFMVQFYPHEELVEISAGLAREADRLEPHRREEHYLAYRQLYEALPRRELRSKLLEATPDTFFKAPDTPEDIAALQQSLAQEPLTADDWLQRGIALAREEQNYAEAETAFRKAIELNPDDATPWNGLGIVLRNQQRYDEAETAFRKAIQLNPDDEHPWNGLGNVLADQQRYDEAETAFRKAIQLNPDDEYPWNGLGNVLADQQSYDEAETAYRKAIQLNPDYATPWFNLGLLLADQQRYDEAETAYRKAIELNPDYEHPWFNLGLLLRNQQRYDEAETAFMKALEITPDDEDNWNGLIALYSREGDDDKDAIGFVQNLLDELGRTAQTLFRAAQALHKTDHAAYFPEAEALARQAVDQQPGDALKNFTLALILGDQGKWPEFLDLVPATLGAPLEDFALQPFIDLCTAGAAAGHAQKLLDLILETQAAAQLEPLTVGLRLFLGQAPKVAQEILEVGKDVAERIRQKQSSSEESTN